jgi:hypothetical protein
VLRRVTDANVRRAERVDRARRQLERAGPPGGSAEPEDVLLDLKMAGIGWSSVLADLLADATANGRSSAIPIAIHVSSGARPPSPRSISLIRAALMPTRLARAEIV